MRASVLFGAKKLRILVCPPGQGELSHCGHFAKKERGGTFSEILFGRLSWRPKNLSISLKFALSTKHRFKFNEIGYK